MFSDHVISHTKKRAPCLTLTPHIDRFVSTGHIQNDRIILTVNLSDLQNRLHNNLTDISEAELEVHYEPQRENEEETKKIRIELFEVRRSNAEEGTESAYVDGTRIDLGREKLLSFDVTPLVQQWQNVRPSEHSSVAESVTLALGVHASYNNGQQLLQQLFSGLMSPGSEERVRPQILVFSHSPSEVAVQHRQRMRRQTLNARFCHSIATRPGLQSARNHCCVRGLYLNFRRDLGWDWIAEPEGFKPNHCAGGCPYRWATSSAYSSVLSQYHSRNPAAAAQPCCVAKELGSITVLFQLSDSNVRIEELSQMTVESCQCR